MGHPNTVLLNEETRAVARKASATLESLATKKPQRFQVRRSKTLVEEVVLPAEVMEALIEMLRQVAQGNAVTVLPTHAELTTQQAADLLNVSRPYLIGLLDDGTIPHRMVGNRRRVLVADVLAHRGTMDRATRNAARELTQETEALGLDH